MLQFRHLNEGDRFYFFGDEAETGLIKSKGMCYFDGQGRRWKASRPQVTVCLIVTKG
jgi:hypothetical protein